ncbi:hypothetical protein LSH36_725g00008 [Paralvinella palmiformis]|uniref:Uncharacterized protein n=1 Tax=Paralvinella palmiformis TaxID=53620 RepID=A0AAD9MTH3_9ANNE|nr:hypothetical protein LSH36_725g00008 [Paralvinella palmiformis]
MGVYDKLYIDSKAPDLSDSNTLQPDESAETTEEPEALITNQSIEIQQVHLWSAHNSLVYTADDQDALPVIDEMFSLPIINAAATEWPTLVTALDQLTRLNAIVSGANSRPTLVVNLDMDLYKRVVKLEYLHTGFKNKWVFSPGRFHTVICTLRCSGRIIEGSGLDDAWQEADLYISVTVSQVLNGNLYNKAIEANQLTLQALLDLWLDKYLEDHPVVRDALVASGKLLTEVCRDKTGTEEANQAFLVDIESLNLEKQLQEFDVRQTQCFNGLGCICCYSSKRLYRKVTGTSTWHHLYKYIFAYARLDYAQNIPEFSACMDAINTSDPELWQSLNVHI